MGRPPGTDNSDHTRYGYLTIPATPAMVTGQSQPHPLWLPDNPSHTHYGYQRAYASRRAQKASSNARRTPNPRKNGILSYSSPLAPGTRSKLNPEFSFEFPPPGAPSRIFFETRFFRRNEVFRFAASLSFRSGNSGATPRPRNFHPFTYTYTPTRTFNRYPRIS